MTNVEEQLSVSSDGSEEDDEDAEQEEELPAPEGPTPPLRLEVGYECKGVVREANLAQIYEAGPERALVGIILIGDFWGWNGGRLREIADYLATSLNALVVVPKLLCRPALEGGTDEDGVPPDFDSKRRQSELRTWLKKYVWESFKTRIESVATHLRNRGVKRIAGMGVCIGAWILCHSSAIIGEYVCSVFASPSIHLLNELTALDDAALARKLKGPALFMRARDDPTTYDEGGEIFSENEKKYGKDSETCSFPSAEHGWITRGEVTEPSAIEDVERAALLAAKFLRKFLWPHPAGADAATLRLRSKEGDEVAAKALLDSGVPAGGKDAVDALGLMPIHYAARAGHFQVIKLLIEYEADVNAHGGACAETALHVASGQNQLKAVRTLLSLTADFMIKDKSGQTALHYAAKEKAISCLRALLLGRAQLSAQDTSLQTALHLATWKGDEQGVSLLLSARMDVEPTDLRVFTPAERARQQGFNTLAQLLDRTKLQREDEEFHATHPAPKAMAANNE